MIHFFLTKILPIAILIAIGFLTHRFYSKPKCPKCGSRRLKSGYFTRGWNKLCTQAYGDDGSICEDCIHVTFNTCLGEHRMILEKYSPWCEDYGR